MKLELSEITSAVRLRVVGVEEGCWYLAVATEAQERLRVSSFGAAPLAHKERARVAHKRDAVASKELGCLFVAHCPRQSQFFSGKQVIHKASCYQSTRRRLQRRSTRSAKQQGRANRNQGKWSFAELLGFIDYKAVNSGSLAIKVDADYTFQSYLGCKSVTRANRSKKGLLFHCENYGFEQHADFVGDRNIPGGMVLTWQDSSRTGCILAIADVSSVDSKTDSKRQLFRAEVGHRLEAERLRRPTIPVLKEVGQDS
ncbi:MAG TPA: zinc ribbon domain-containing protein [Candidatus Obscuribacterales bacterium]